MVPTHVIGNASLYCADNLCFLENSTLSLTNLILTDPPYGVGIAGWDSKIETEWLLFARNACKTVMFTPGIKNMYNWPTPDWVAAYSFPNGAKRSVGGGINCWEPVLIYGKNKLGLDHRSFAPIIGDVVKGHPTPKPLEPFQWMVMECSEPDDVVFDPFMGSGTTGVAAILLGRKFIGIEKNPEYYNIACNRIRLAVEQSAKQSYGFFSAQKAVKPASLFKKK